MAESKLFLSDTKPRSCLILSLDIPSEMSFSEARRISRETRSLMERTESESKAGTDAAVFFLNAALCRKTMQAQPGPPPQPQLRRSELRQMHLLRMQPQLHLQQPRCVLKYCRLPI